MERLPAEITKMIAKEVHTHPHSERDFLSLILTSRRLQNTYYSELYRQIRLHPINMKLARLVMRLWKHPNLADHSRILRLAQTGGPPPPQHIRMDDDVAAFFEEALHMILTPEQEQTGIWKFHSEQKIISPTAWTTLLLICARNVQTIEIDHTVAPPLLHVTTKAITREKPFEQAPTFQNLRRISQRSNGRGLFNGSCLLVNSGYLDAVPYVPNIEQIVADQIVDFPDLIPPEIPLPNVPSNLLPRPNFPRISPPLGRNPQGPHRLLWSSAHAQVARLSYDPNGYQAANDPFGSFKEFPALQHLAMRYAHVRGSLSLKPFSQILPGSLKILKISAPMEDTEVELFRALIEMLRSGIFPMIHRLEVGRENPATVGGDAAMQSLRRECEAMGVALLT
ncbi:unnamed protein product [Penicillium bialowiezense]